MTRPTTPELALRDAVRTLLRADAGFASLAGRRFYDEVPAGLGRAEPHPAEARPPYAYLGPIRRAGYAESCVAAWTIQARLYAVSTAYDRDQGWLLADAMIAALNGLEQPDLPLADPYSLRTPLEVVQAGDVIDPLQAKSVFLDLRTTVVRPLPGEET